MAPRPSSKSRVAREARASAMARDACASPCGRCRAAPRHRARGRRRPPSRCHGARPTRTPLVSARAIATTFASASLDVGRARARAASRLHASARARRRRDPSMPRRSRREVEREQVARVGQQVGDDEQSLFVLEGRAAARREVRHRPRHVLRRRLAVVVAGEREPQPLGRVGGALDAELEQVPNSSKSIVPLESASTA